MADTLYNNLDKNGLLFLLTLLNNTLTASFNSINQTIQGVKPTDSLTADGQNAVTSAKIYAAIQEVKQLIQEVETDVAEINGNIVTSIDPSAQYDVAALPSVKALIDYVKSLYSTGITDSDNGLVVGSQVAAYVTSVLAEGVGFKTVIADALPPVEEGKENTFYFIPNPSSTEENNIYDEYLFFPASGDVAAHYEHIGTTAVDLTGYLKESQLVPISNTEITEIFNSVFGTTS